MVFLISESLAMAYVTLNRPFLHYVVAVQSAFPQGSAVISDTLCDLTQSQAL